MREAFADNRESEPLVQMKRGVRSYNRNAKWFPCLGRFFEKPLDQHCSNPAASILGQQGYIHTAMLCLDSFNKHTADDSIVEHYDLVNGLGELRDVSVKLSLELHPKNRVALRDIERMQIVSHRLAEKLVQELFVVGRDWAQRDRHRFEPPELSCTA
jgi:hypothetical protein